MKQTNWNLYTSKLYGSESICDEIGIPFSKIRRFFMNWNWDTARIHNILLALEEASQQANCYDCNWKMNFLTNSLKDEIKTETNRFYMSNVLRVELKKLKFIKTKFFFVIGILNRHLSFLFFIDDVSTRFSSIIHRVMQEKENQITAFLFFMRQQAKMRSLNKSATLSAQFYSKASCNISSKMLQKI